MRIGMGDSPSTSVSIVSFLQEDSFIKLYVYYIVLVYQYSVDVCKIYMIIAVQLYDLF